MEDTEKTERHEDFLETRVDNEMGVYSDPHSVAGSVSPARCSQARGSKSEGRSRFTPLLRRVGQQVLSRAFGSQGFTPQIKRNFLGAGYLLSSRTSRTEVLCAEMLLFPYSILNPIPIHMPAVQRRAIPMSLPERFTGKDAERETADVGGTRVPVHPLSY